MNKLILKIFSFIFIVNFLSASQITFHVDMNGQTVSANGVHVAGNFGDYDYDNTFENPAYPNWDPAGIALTDDDSDQEHLRHYVRGTGARPSYHRQVPP